MSYWQPSACLIALRACSDDVGFEVMLAKRAEGLRLAPGHHVFPGGALEHVDGQIEPHDDSAFKRAAVREFKEEVCERIPFSLTSEKLLFLGEWRAPEFLTKRYLTRFYVAFAEPSEICCDGLEIVSAQWYRPEDAVNLHRLGDIQLMFPTLAILDWLASFGDGVAMFAQLKQRSMKSVCPVLKVEAGVRYLSIGAGSGYRIERWRVD